MTKGLHHGWRQADTLEKQAVEKLVGRFTLMGLDVSTVGSRKIKGGYHPTDKKAKGIVEYSDFDFLIPVTLEESYKKVTQILTRNGFELGGSLTIGSSFQSYKKEGKESWNFILGWGDFPEKFLSAQELVEMLCVTDKEDRIKIFNYLGKREEGGTLLVSEEDFKETIDKYSSS